MICKWCFEWRRANTCSTSRVLATKINQLIPHPPRRSDFWDTKNSIEITFTTPNDAGLGRYYIFLMWPEPCLDR